MNKKITLCVLAGMAFLSGCMSSGWEIRQMETTFMNEETREAFDQKNAILLNNSTGETWILESDSNSNYFWLKMSEGTKEKQ